VATSVATRRLPRIAGYTIAALAVVLEGITLALMVLDHDSPAPVPGLSPVWSWTVQAILTVTSGLTLGLVAGAIVARQPWNRFGRCIALTAVCVAVVQFLQQYAIHGLLVEPASLPLADWAARIGDLLSLLSWLGAFMGLLLFPNGQLASRWWRPLVLAGWIVNGLYFVLELDRNAWIGLGFGFSPGLAVPVSMPPAAWTFGADMRWTGDALRLARPPLLLMAAITLILRMRQADGEERLQLRWVAWSGTVAGLFTVAWLPSSPGIQLNFWPAWSGHGQAWGQRSVSQPSSRLRWELRYCATTYTTSMSWSVAPYCSAAWLRSSRLPTSPSCSDLVPCLGTGRASTRP